MNIANNTLYEPDDFAKIIAKKTNKILVLVYSQDNKISYTLTYISFLEFTNNDNLYKNIKDVIKNFDGGCCEVEIGNQHVDIRLPSTIIEISNIPNFDSINEKELIKGIKQN